MKKIACLVAAALAAPLAQSADIEAGKAKVASVCSACHGMEGVSVSEGIPNLAAQRAGYIESQLKALKDGSRKNPIMNAIAAQLAPDDMKNVAAYFASLPGAAPAAKSPFMPALAKSHVTFAEGYRETFTRYHAKNFPDRNQVQVFFANKTALDAARAGKPLPDGSVIFSELYAAKLDANRKPVTGADGLFEHEKLLAYLGMARDAGWGNDVPDMLRNENWNYAAFTPDKQPLPLNQAECLACHKPQDRASYVFTLKELAASK